MYIYIYSIWIQTDLHDSAFFVYQWSPLAPDRKGHVRERSKVFLGGGKMAARPRPAPDFQWYGSIHPNAHVGYTPEI